MLLASLAADVLLAISRSARILSWWALSSPLTYNMVLSGMLSTVCNVSVLLPMPGSPPSSTMLPATSPPPSTLFSSLSCMSMRGSSCEGMSLSFTGRLLLVAEWLWLNRLPEALSCDDVPMCISLNVFHCPQLGHLPIHFVDSCPQLLQTYTVFVFAMC